MDELHCFVLIEGDIMGGVVGGRSIRRYQGSGLFEGGEGEEKE